LSRLWLVIFALNALGQTSQTQTSKTMCDADLIRQANPRDVDRYMDRGGRCEGLYAEEVSLTGNLIVASLTTGPVTSNSWPGKPLTVRCRYKQTADVHIQAFLLQPRPFYRLDALQRGAVISWNWDTEVIAKYAKPSNVGLVAWTSTLIDGLTQRVYLPISDSLAGPGGPIKLIILPPVAISEAYVTIESTTPGDKPLRQRAPVGKGSYLRNQRIEIDLPPLPHEGLYRVEVTGRDDTGSVSAPAFLIYTSGN
jgi:hypothetical protein